MTQAHGSILSAVLQREHSDEHYGCRYCGGSLALSERAKCMSRFCGLNKLQDALPV